MRPELESLPRLGIRRRTDRRCLAVIALARDIIELGRPALVSHLTAAEFARCEALRSNAARDAFIASHALVRYVAGALAGVDAARLVLVQRCDICGGPHGAPSFRDHPNLHASLSHSAGVVAAAAADVPVGIDVESWDHARCFEELQHSGAFSPNEIRVLAGRPHHRDDPGGLSPFEADALQLWLRKECLVKLGCLDLDTLGSCDLSHLPLPDSALPARYVKRSRPWSSKPRARGAPSKPASSRCRNTVCTVAVHGCAGRRTSSPASTAPKTRPPGSRCSVIPRFYRHQPSTATE